MSKRNERPLEAYRRKRAFDRTAEPFGGGKGRSQQPIFVIQKHAASRLHYDFRIEVDGVLKSWAVPKGPSTDPRERRLALPTEDHPIQYADFEGTIAEDDYGGGTVMVWDAGTYRNLKETEENGPPLTEQLQAGHVTIWLEGRKLTGGYALNRIAEEPEERWLLVKIKDEGADARRNPVRTQYESELSGRSLAAIEEAEKNDRQAQAGGDDTDG